MTLKILFSDTVTNVSGSFVYTTLNGYIGIGPVIRKQSLDGYSIDGKKVINL